MNRRTEIASTWVLLSVLLFTACTQKNSFREDNPQPQSPLVTPSTTQSKIVDLATDCNTDNIKKKSWKLPFTPLVPHKLPDGFRYTRRYVFDPHSKTLGDRSFSIETKSDNGSLTLYQALNDGDADWISWTIKNSKTPRHEITFIHGFQALISTPEEDIRPEYQDRYIRWRDNERMLHLYATPKITISKEDMLKFAEGLYGNP